MNLTDRELLELAAKAAGMEIVLWDFSCVPQVRHKYDHQSFAWNPLKDGDAALRLVTTLCFSVIQYMHSVEIMIGNELIHRELSDGKMNRTELTLRAIVRAAAAIQLSKEGK